MTHSDTQTKSHFIHPPLRHTLVIEGGREGLSQIMLHLISITGTEAAKHL